MNTKTQSTKVCRKCLTEKYPNDFYRDKRAKDGLRSWCKVCAAGAVMRSQHKKADKYNRYALKQRKLRTLKKKLQNYEPSGEIDLQQEILEMLRDTEHFYRLIARKQLVPCAGS